MKITTQALLFPILLLAACQAEVTTTTGPGPGTKDSDQSIFRFELEIVGNGNIDIIEPEDTACEPNALLCSFSVPQGTVVVLEGDFYPDEGGWQEDCDGFERCTLMVEHDVLVVADFGYRGPDVIVDPFPVHPLDIQARWTDSEKYVMVGE